MVEAINAITIPEVQLLIFLACLVFGIGLLVAVTIRPLPKRKVKKKDDE